MFFAPQVWGTAQRFIGGIRKSTPLPTYWPSLVEMPWITTVWSMSERIRAMVTTMCSTNRRILYCTSGAAEPRGPGGQLTPTFSSTRSTCGVWHTTFCQLFQLRHPTFRYPPRPLLYFTWLVSRLCWRNKKKSAVKHDGHNDDEERWRTSPMR